MSRSIAVLGLGKFGSSLAESLYSLGMDLMVVDRDPERIREFSSKSTVAVCANLENEDEVMALELNNMDIVVAAMGSNLAASIMCVAVAKDQKVPVVVAKSSNDRMSSLLKKIGVDKILDPEGEGGLRSASILLSSSFRDFFELDSNMYIIEMDIKKEWVGKSLRELDLRKNYSLNVVAVKEKGHHWEFVDPNKIFSETCILLIVAEKKDLKFGL